ncbi:uncharacterized protein ccsapa isoform X2 [Phycodurus eques]|uniref:uncharacterized protein ccsapa isoform X2 n=1 Tax=Phycodurus eques TaxID=693459 RepID=UPI002ACD510A|nr:uncharacterized protein ccsapa isoform X2 [Phycodurus eques]
MVTKKVRTEYMKKFREPKWETFSKCYEDSLKYRLTRRVMEHSHKPWFWEGWEGGSVLSSGWSTPRPGRNRVAPLLHETNGLRSGPDAEPPSGRGEEEAVVATEVAEVDAAAPEGDITGTGGGSLLLQRGGIFLNVRRQQTSPLLLQTSAAPPTSWTPTTVRWTRRTQMGIPPSRRPYRSAAAAAARLARSRDFRRVATATSRAATANLSGPRASRHKGAPGTTRGPGAKTHTPGKPQRPATASVVTRASRRRRVLPTSARPPRIVDALARQTWRS